jgi:hypothetical protein
LVRLTAPTRFGTIASGVLANVPACLELRFRTVA